MCTVCRTHVRVRLSRVLNELTSSAIADR